jgi:general stress protein 26
VKKRLMMNVMTLRQCYERREIIEMKWVHETHNLVDFMTKSKSSSALRMMIDINQINLNTTEWVERATTREIVNQIKKDSQVKEIELGLDEMNE